MNSFYFLSLIPELKNQSGHHYPYHRKMEEAIIQLGGDFSAYTNRKCNIHFENDRWKKWFQRKKEPGFKPYRIYQLLRGYTHIFKKTFGKNKRYFFLESFTTGDLIPFVLSILLFAKKNDVIWILFRFDLNNWEMKLQTILMKVLKYFIKDKLVLFCDNDILSKVFEYKFNQKILLFPYYPFPTNIVIKDELKIKKEKITCSWLGGPRKEKGLSVIQNLFTLKDLSAQFFTFVYSLKAPLPLSHKEIRIRLTKEHLDWEDYIIELEKSDVLLLPYDSNVYHQRTSGIFIEAIMMGKIPLVSEGTWLSHQLKDFNLEELIINWNDPQFFTNVYQLVNNEIIQFKLKHMQNEYRKIHSMETLKLSIQQLIG